VIGDGSSGDTGTGDAVAAVQDVAFATSTAQGKFMLGVTAGELMLVVLVPPLVATLLRRRRAGRTRTTGNST
jgi:hypothetical protein